MQQLRRLGSQQLVDDIVPFYEEAPAEPFDEFYECERCGILEWREGRWQGIRPDYCSAHRLDAPHIHRYDKPQNLRRLIYGIHLRTFLPGRAEIRLFDWADELHQLYPAELIGVEHYPGFDTYDLRLNFGDGTVWGVDVKDHKHPTGLAAKVKPPYGQGELAYSKMYFVVPDARVDAVSDYWEVLHRQLRTLPKQVQVERESVFRQVVEAHLATLHRGKKTGRKGRKEA